MPNAAGLINPSFSVWIEGRNTITDSVFGFVGGGDANDVLAGATYSSIAGGQTNIINDADWASCGGGFANLIKEDSNYGTIAGGRGNQLQQDADAVPSTFCFIGGGDTNKVLDSKYAVIAGGEQNEIVLTSPHSTIAGGEENLVTAAAHAAVLGGKDKPRPSRDLNH